ncbi:PP2C family protein-serine/threonine phosphatase [Dethiothermospora halolimnae]|uniref:PP2C family protein-serine/threonine phosphatase n=1 Tax=Dethiothermospora halolimnae TaxID=3114390 RepID=UPI003CCBB991
MNITVNGNEYIYLIILSSIMIAFLTMHKYYSLRSNNNIYGLNIETFSDFYTGNREFQEDSAGVLFLDKGIMAVLADGHGKNKIGKICSQLVVKIFEDMFKSEKSISNTKYFFKKTFNIANREILKALDDKSGGTSVVSAIIKNNKLYYGSVGNTRICLFRNNELIPLNEGHTVDVIAKKRFKEGKIPKHYAQWALENKNIFNYIGQDEFKNIEINNIPIKMKKDDIIVLMSDGIYNFVPSTILEDYLSRHRLLSCKEISKKIIEYLDNLSIRGKDNGSIILIKYKSNILRV